MLQEIEPISSAETISAPQALLPVYSQKAREIAIENNINHEIIEDGFLTYNQVARFQLTYEQEKVEGHSHKEALNTAIEQVKYDVDGYFNEFLLRQSILRIHAGYDSQGLIATKYGGGRYLDYFDDIERGGYTKLGMQKLEEVMLQANVGDTLLIASPRGQSGYGHDHPDSHIYFYKKLAEGKIDAFTIRNDMDLYQINNFLGLVTEGEYEPYLEGTHYENIQDIVNTVVYRPQGSTFSTPFEILAAIKTQLKYTDTIWTDPDNHNAHNFNLVSQQVTQRQQLDEFNDIVAKVLVNLEAEIQSRFKNRVRFSDRNIEWLTKKISDSVMDTGFILNNPGVSTKFRRDKQAEKQQIEQASGCSSPVSARRYSSEDVRVLRNLGFKYYESGKQCKMCLKSKKWLGPCTVCPECDNRFK